MTRQRLSPRRSTLLGILTLVFTLVVLDGLLSATLLRNGRFQGVWVPPFKLIFTDEQAGWLGNANSDTYGRFDPELGWSIRPNGTKEGKLYRVRANSAGFRASREYSLEPPQGIVRIAAFGNSYTHGAYVSNEETWEHLLEISRPGLEVLNFGVNAYGVDQAYLRYRRDGSRFKPKVVLIGLMIENILRSVSVYRPTLVHKTPLPSVKPRFHINAGSLELIPCPVGSASELVSMIESNSLLKTLNETDYWVQRAPRAYQQSPFFWSSLARIIYGFYEHAGREVKDHYLRASEPFRVTLEVIGKFSDEALKRGADQVFVLIFPDQSAVQIWLAGEYIYWKTIADALAAKGISVLDLTPELAKAARDQKLSNLFSHAHYTRTANALVAETLARSLFPAIP
jgi:hypothetical protein